MIPKQRLSELKPKQKIWIRPCTKSHRDPILTHGPNFQQSCAQQYDIEELSELKPEQNQQGYGLNYISFISCFSSDTFGGGYQKNF